MTDSQPHNSHDRHATDPHAVNPHATDPGAVDPHATDPRAVDPHATDPRAVDPHATDPQAANPQAAERHVTDPHATDPRTTGLRCRVRVGSADGILAVVPHLLGFHPTDSLVMLGIGGPHARIRLAFRYDLPDPPEDGLASDIAAHAATVLRRQHLTMAIAVGYGLARTVTPVVDVVDTGAPRGRDRPPGRAQGGRRPVLVIPVR